MSATPPPPGAYGSPSAYGAPGSPGAHSAKPKESVPPVAWLIPVAGLLAIIGACVPWFKPKITASANGQTISRSVNHALYSWKDGKIGLLAPIVLAILGILVVQLIMGRTPNRFSRTNEHPVRTAARGALIAGVVSAVCCVVAWFLLPHQYKFTDGGHTYSWDDYIKAIEASVPGAHASISHGPQLGFWLTAAAAALAIIGGALMLVTHKAPASAPATYAPPAAPGGSWPAAGGQSDNAWSTPSAPSAPANPYGATPPAYQPPAPTYQPPTYQPPAPASQPPTYQPPAPTYQPPTYQPPAPSYPPPADPPSSAPDNPPGNPPTWVPQQPPSNP